MLLGWPLCLSKPFTNDATSSEVKNSSIISRGDPFSHSIFNMDFELCIFKRWMLKQIKRWAWNTRQSQWKGGDQNDFPVSYATHNTKNSPSSPWMQRRWYLKKFHGKINTNHHESRPKYTTHWTAQPLNTRNLLANLFYFSKNYLSSALLYGNEA